MQEERRGFCLFLYGGKTWRDIDIKLVRRILGGEVAKRGEVLQVACNSDLKEVKVMLDLNFPHLAPIHVVKG